MSSILFYECFSGISGDMNLAAMLDLGVPQDHLERELQKLNLKGYELKVTREARNSISGTRVDVLIGPEHHHRHLSDINRIIDDSRLDRQTKDLSKKIFLKVAVAEAKVHQIPIEKVHFHEVGAIDSIVDIVGAAICYKYLKVDKVISTPPELGGGMVKTAHGTLPVPAPATVEILKGIPVHRGGANFETTTPTGAAIIAAFATEFAIQGTFKILKTGYGIGHKQSDIPNFLRVHLCEEETGKDQKTEKAYILECNIDDMNPEWYDLVMEKLFNAGVQDVYLTHIIMKKNRPGVKLNVLCTGDMLEKVKYILLTETTTLGVRILPVEKSMLERRFTVLNTRFGEVRLKSAWLNGKMIRQKPEYDDCKKIAMENKLSLGQVMEEIESALKQKP